MIKKTAKNTIIIFITGLMCILTAGCSDKKIVINFEDETEIIETEEITSSIKNEESTYQTEEPLNIENIFAKDIFSNASIFCTECEMNGELIKDGCYRVDFSDGTIFSKDNVPLHSEFIVDFLIAASSDLTISDDQFFYSDDHINGYGFIKIKNGQPYYVYYTSENPEQTTDYQIGVYPENVIEDFDYNSFDHIKTVIDQNTLDEMAHEVFDLSEEAISSLSTDDQSTLFLGAASFEEILEWSGYSINNVNSDFLKKYASEQWVHIDTKLNYDNYNFYVEYVSLFFDDNCAYVNSQSGAKGIYNNPITYN